MRTAAQEVAAGGAGSYRGVFTVGEFRALFAVHTLRVCADNLVLLALAVLIYERTGSAFGAALGFMAGMLPQVFGGMLLLSLADRTKPRRLLIALTLLRLAVVAGMAAGAPPAAAVGLSMLLGLVAPLNVAAVQGMLPDLLSGEDYVLGRSVLTMSMAVMQALGHAVGAAVLLVGADPRDILWLAAATGPLALVITVWGVSDRPSRTRSPGKTGTVRATWLANCRLLADARVRGLLLAQWVPFSLAVGAEGVIVPYAADLGQPGLAGLMLSAVAVGLFMGNLVMGRLASPSRRARLVMPTALVAGGTLVLFALHPPAFAAVALMSLFASGLAYELGMQQRFTEAVPSEAGGQAFGLLSTGLMTGQAVCIAAAGAFADLVSPGTAIAACGLAALVSVVLLHRQMSGGWPARSFQRGTTPRS